MLEKLILKGYTQIYKQTNLIMVIAYWENYQQFMLIKPRHGDKMLYHLSMSKLAHWQIQLAKCKIHPLVCFFRAKFWSEHIKLVRQVSIMISKNIQDWPIMHFDCSKILNFLEQSNQGTLLGLRTSTWNYNTFIGIVCSTKPILIHW